MNNIRKKICFVAPSLQMGGIERALSSMANYIADNYPIDVFYVTIYRFEHFFSLSDKITLHEPPYEFPRTGRSVFQTFCYYFRVLSPLSGHIKRKIFEIHPDSVVSYGDWFPHLIMLGVRNRIPFYYSNRSNPNIRYSFIQEIVRKLAYTFTPPTGVIAQTTAAAARKKRLLGNKSRIEIIPNPARKVNNSDTPKCNYIISVGRLHLEKGFVRLLQVFSMLEIKDWKLVLVGTGIHEKELRNKAEELQIIDNVIFTGKTKDVDKWLNISKIFVLSSHGEGFPNALCEGMAAGLACVSFDIIAGPSDIVTHGENGLLVPDNDLNGMKSAIEKLMNDESLRLKLGNEAKLVVNKYSFEIISRKFVDFVLNQ